MTDEIASVPTPPMKGKGKIGKSIFPLKASEVAGHMGFMEREPRVHVSGIIRVHEMGSRSLLRSAPWEGAENCS
jgi:hypothetical protein